MRGLSLFSGIGGLDLAAEWAGIEPVAFCEIEPYAVSILKKRWPDVPVLDDVRKITKNKLEKAILYGKMERKYVCENCGASGNFKDGRSMVQAHHPDYNKPLEVMWLCQKCHHEWHKNNMPEERKEVMPDGSHETIDIVYGGFPQ